MIFDISFWPRNSGKSLNNNILKKGTRCLFSKKLVGKSVVVVMLELEVYDLRQFSVTFAVRLDFCLLFNATY